jgi:hypothetical protein
MTCYFVFKIMAFQMLFEGVGHLGYAKGSRDQGYVPRWWGLTGAQTTFTVCAVLYKQAKNLCITMIYQYIVTEKLLYLSIQEIIL